MSHFAEVQDGIVVNVIVAEQDFIDTLDGTWIQTSYNTRGGKHYDPETGEEDDGTPLRKNYAVIGGAYDADRDAFISPQTFPSWILNEESCIWEPPTSCPEVGKEHLYYWNEDAYQADNAQGWEKIFTEEA